MSRPLVSVYSGVDGTITGHVKFAGVMQTPIRTDVVCHVHRDISKNHRQPYAVSRGAGHQTSAESWGTGRAVARIPRVPGGGTHRAGQGAFGNMCRGGHMFAPTKTYRRWHRKVNKNQRRFAIVSSLAASASAPLVLARGHRIEQIPEIPLVVKSDTLDNLDKTSAAIKLLKLLNAFSDVEKSIHSRKIRAGKGKARNRRYVVRRGPLIIYEQKSSLCRAFRNLPGVDLCCVTRLSLLQLAPGGHVGRFIIWTSAAYQRLESLYGTYKTRSKEKLGYTLPRAVVTTSNIHRLMKAPEITSLLRRRKKIVKRPRVRNNPLTNIFTMIKLNPYAKTLRRQELLRSNPGVQARVALHDQRRKSRRDAVKKAREKKGFTPKPNPRPAGARLPLVEFLKKRGKKLNRNLQRREQRKVDAKDRWEKNQAAGRTAEQAKKEKKAKKLADAQKPKKARRVGRGPLPAKSRMRSHRYDPEGLKRFRVTRSRILQRADRQRHKSILPAPTAGEAPFVEFHRRAAKKKAGKGAVRKAAPVKPDPEAQKATDAKKADRKEKLAQKRKLRADFKKQKGAKKEKKEKKKKVEKVGDKFVNKNTNVAAFRKLLLS